MHNLREYGPHKATEARRGYGDLFWGALQDILYIKFKLPIFKLTAQPCPTHGPGRHNCMPCASLTPLDGARSAFMRFPMPQNRENRAISSQIGQIPQKRLRNG
jgi:hypothetical protein